MRTTIYLVLSLLVFILTNQAIAQNTDTIKLYDLSIEELMNIKIKVNSIDVNENIREAPGVFTVITKDEIYNNQCHNLVDVFNMIPGLSTGKDIMDFFGLFSRGMYGLEGRALVMLNGMPLNEMYWGIFSYGGGFPVNLIEKIEVIRGPGSVIYGGNAELCVINIISTQDISSENNVKIFASSGFLKNDFGHNDIGVNINTNKDKLSLSALFYEDKSIVADGQIHTKAKQPDYYYSTYDAFGRKGALASLNIDYDKKYYIKMNSHLQEMNYSSPALKKSSKYEYNLFSSELGANFNISKKIISKLSALYANSLWTPFRGYPIIVHRIKPSFNANYSTKNLDVLIGTEFIQDIAIPRDKRINTTSASNTDTIIDSKPFIHGYKQDLTYSASLWTVALFSTVKYKIKNLNIIAGCRYDKNEFYGHKTSPRFALTYVKRKFNAKAIYSQAFRAPNIANAFGVGSVFYYENAALTEDELKIVIEQNKIKREKTEVYEIQLGYLFKKFYITANLFKQRTYDIIEFNSAFNYLSINGGELGTSGVEAEVSYKSKKYVSKTNFSYVKPDKTEGKTYVVPVSVTWNPNTDVFDNKHFLGVSNIKVFTSHTYNLYKKLSINLHAFYFSEKYFSIHTVNNVITNQKLNSQIILGAGVIIENVFIKSLDLTFSVEDITNQKMNIVSAFDAYNYSSDFLPYRGAEISFSLRYRFN